MLCFKFHKNRIINEEFDFLGVKGEVLVGLGVEKVGTTWKHVPENHRKLLLPNNLCTIFVRGFTLSPVNENGNCESKVWTFKGRIIWELLGGKCDCCMFIAFILWRMMHDEKKGRDSSGLTVGRWLWGIWEEKRVSW